MHDGYYEGLLKGMFEFSMDGAGEGQRGWRVPTGLEEVDALLGGGLPKGCVTALGGRAGAGKSALARAVAVAAAREGTPVLYVDTEDVPEQWAAKMLAAASGYPIGDVASGWFRASHMKETSKAAQDLLRLPICYRRIDMLSYDVLDGFIGEARLDAPEDLLLIVDSASDVGFEDGVAALHSEAADPGVPDVAVLCTFSCTDDASFEARAMRSDVAVSVTACGEGISMLSVRKNRSARVAHGALRIGFDGDTLGISGIEWVLGEAGDSTATPADASTPWG